MDERTTRLAIGGGLLAVGVFLSVSFYNVLELLLYATAAIMGVVGLVAVPVLWIKKWHPSDIAVAGGVGVGGVALAVHDLFPGGIVLHVAAALAALVAGGVVTYRGFRMPRGGAAA